MRIVVRSFKESENGWLPFSVNTNSDVRGSFMGTYTNIVFTAVLSKEISEMEYTAQRERLKILNQPKPLTKEELIMIKYAPVVMGVTFFILVALEYFNII